MFRQRNFSATGCLIGWLIAVIMQMLRLFLLWVLPFAFIASVWLTRAAVAALQPHLLLTRTQVVGGTALGFGGLASLFGALLVLGDALWLGQLLICVVAGLLWGVIVGLRVALTFMPQQRFTVENRPADLFGVPDNALRTGQREAEAQAWPEDGVFLGEEVPWSTR